MAENILSNSTADKVVENVEKVASGVGKVGGKVVDMLQEAVQTTVSDTDSSGLEEFSILNYFSSFFIHIALIVIVIGLKWQYDRNRYRYPKGPRDWRHISDAISFHRKKRENLLVLANDYPQMCTVVTHVGRVILLNDPSLINEIFIGRADLCSNKIDSYLENQLRYKTGKHLRTGIVFRHYDHNGQVIHRSLVEHVDQILAQNKLDQVIQEQFEQFRSYLSSNSSKFDVRRSTFRFALHILTQLCINRTFKYDDKVFETFTNNLYKISKTIHEDTVAKTSKVALTQLTGLSETLDINETVLNYIQEWVKERHPNETTDDSQVTSTSSGDILDSIIKVVPTAAPHIDNEDVAAMILDVVMHGSEMLKGALTWLLLYVVKYPHEANEARREANSKCDDGKTLTVTTSGNSALDRTEFCGITWVLKI
ncbi:unnamed protein product [Didymodactylos carnosus]|uniref:Cytochrome P450 n=1 Tax=Didymodactylos carnosus TaxID=1234261 RepID=A0A8S2F4A5_9BILA|nr:unnamed protein product [Didymodactylos carnosus]CAF4147329.1 unnamed protein product [Didymodactylos carnosus]